MTSTMGIFAVILGGLMMGVAYVEIFQAPVSYDSPSWSVFFFIGAVLGLFGGIMLAFNHSGTCLPQIRFFRSCPSCGRRFHIKLMSKNLAVVQRTSVPIRHSTLVGTAAHGRGRTVMYPVVYEGKPITVNFEEFRYSYSCTPCGHSWSEKQIKKETAR